MRELITESIDDVIMEDNKIILDFYGDWCQPCKMMNPILERINEETDYEVIKVNSDDYSDDMTKYGVTGLPTFIVFERGEQVNKFSGAMLYERFIDKLNP